MLETEEGDPETFFCYPRIEFALFPSVGWSLFGLLLLLSWQGFFQLLILKLWHCWCDLNTQFKAFRKRSWDLLRSVSENFIKLTFQELPWTLRFTPFKIIASFVVAFVASQNASSLIHSLSWFPYGTEFQGLDFHSFPTWDRSYPDLTANPLEHWTDLLNYS